MKYTSLGTSGRVFLIEDFEENPPVVLKFAPIRPNPGETLNERQKLERVEEARPLLEKYQIPTPHTVADPEFARTIADAFFTAGGTVKDRHELQPIIQHFEPAPILGEIGRMATAGTLEKPVDISGFDGFWQRYEAFRTESGIAHNDVFSLNITLDDRGNFGMIDWGNAIIRDVDGPDVFDNAVCTENLINEMVNKRVLESIRNPSAQTPKTPPNNAKPTFRPF